MLVAEELNVVFQPIVALSDDSVFAQEALVRCTRPEWRYPPALFDEAAAWNCTGELGRMIREIAVPQVRGQRLFVNVHPGELDQSFLMHPDDPIFAHDNEIFLELTESLPLTDLARSSAALRELRERTGVQVAIDDLGSGYSNLRAITELEPAFVKLDRGLIHGISRNVRQQKMAGWLVRMCADLGARVVAEGVETEEDLAAVRDAGIDFAQGFLLGRPSAARTVSGVCPVVRAR
jgi:EAL domain-containing protein (putative c-di-GMP-specific phosphodiesterase class I)